MDALSSESLGLLPGRNTASPTTPTNTTAGPPPPTAEPAPTPDAADRVSLSETAERLLGDLGALRPGGGLLRGLGNFLARPANGGRGIGISQSLMRRMDAQFEQLQSFSPEHSERFGLLAQVLAALDPERADTILARVSETMENFLRLGRELSGQSQAPPPPPPEAAPAPPTTGQAFSFSIEIEVEMTERVSASVARLEEEGFQVQTVEVERTQRVSLRIEFGMAAEQKQSDPLALDLAGDGIHLSGARDGAFFDIDGDGRAEQTGFVQGDDAFLALDRNGNGRIDSGRELFGDQHGAANGFEELARYDDNGDGRIDRRDAIFADLSLLHDRNGDGRVSKNETSTLAEQGVESIDLGYQSGPRQSDGRGNALAERGFFERADGSRGQAIDVWVGHA